MSTSAQAVAAATRLQTTMRRYGVECRFQLRQGASGSGWMTPLSQRVGVMSHHVASRPSQGNTPFYNLVRNGRGAAPGAPAVPGPLANGYMGFDGIYRIITLGWANHPGAGGPITLPKGTVPRDNGRPRFWGTEYEGGFEDWSAFMHDKMARANAAILDWLNLTTAAHIEHSTWAPSRKIDRRGYTAASGRNRITAVRGSTGGGSPAPTPTPTPEEDMPLTDAEIDKIAHAVWTREITGRTAQNRLRDVGADAASATVNAPVKISGATKSALGVDAVSMAGLSRYGGASLFEQRNQHAETRTRFAALTAAVQALSSSVDVNPKDVTDAIDKAVAAALADLKVTLTTEGD